MGKSEKSKAKNSISERTIRPSEAAETLGVSEATIRNWVKLGRLVPTTTSPMRFYEKDILKLAGNLKKTDKLKSRRNKKRLTTNFFPKSYISSSSVNYPVIKRILESASEKEASLSAVIYLSAKKLLEESNIPSEISDELLKPFCLDAGSDLSAIDQESVNSLLLIPGEDTLGMLYLSLRRLQDKKSTGSYYTPFHVVDKLILDIPKSTDNNVCDPACGTGNFLLRLPKYYSLDNIFGYDIDEKAVSIARINLALKCGINSRKELLKLIDNIRTVDFLSENTLNHIDIMLGNPPWGFVFSKDEIQRIQNSFSSYESTKQPESFSLFVEKALRQLPCGGTMSFLLPETILYASIHREIRRLILSMSQIVSLTYIGEVFDKVQCPSIILTLRKNNDNGSVPESNIKVSFEKADHEHFDKLKEFTSGIHLDESGFHILADDKERQLLEKILSSPHFCLKDNADFALGIVTGQNKILLKSAPGRGLEPILKGKEIEKFRHRSASNYVNFEPERFQQCAPTSMYRAGEKLFYRFIADEPIVALDREKTLSLNSANIIIPKVEGYCPAYIMAILNSSVISFFYKKSFKNLKVLRAYLEQLPIAKCSRDEEKQIADMALLLADMPQGSKDFDPLFKKLDKQVAKLYGINDTEYQKITSKI